MYIFAAVSTFFIYQMLSKSYKDCIKQFISDTFLLPEEEKQLEIRKPENNEIENVFLIKKNDSFKITNKYNNIKEYLGEENVNVKKLDKKSFKVHV